MDNSASESGFTIQRDTNSNFPAPTVINVGSSGPNTAYGGTLTYTDSSVSPGTKYYYRVRAADANFTPPLTQPWNSTPPLLSGWSNTGAFGVQYASVLPTTLAFGNQALNTTSAAQTATLSNTGSASLTISGTTITGANPGDFARTTTCGASLAASASCTFSVTFRPTAAGARTASLSITTNDPLHPTVAVPLSGTGISVIAGVSPTSLAFGNQLLNTTSGARTVTLSNTGSASMTIISITLAGTNPGDFARTTSCTGSLAAGGSCTISVTFTPTVMGGRAALLNISTTDPVNPTRTVPLSGTGIQMIAGVAPTSLVFANQLLNTTSPAQTVLLSNTGTATLAVNSITLTGTNPGDFARTTTCGATLGIGGTCTISVTFRPTVMGGRAASLTISTNDPVNPILTVPLGGTGIAPIATAVPTPITFVNQALNTTSPAQTVWLLNPGTAPLTINSITLAGTNPGDFAQTNACPASLAAAGNCTISVTFHPTAGGARTASLSISSSDPATPTLTVPLNGLGISVIAGVAPTALSFGNQALNTTSAAQTVTLSNTGTATMTIGGIGLTGTQAGDFAQTNACGGSLAGGGSCLISVTFTPTAGGPRGAGLAITSNDPVNPTLTVPLSGTGVAPNAGVAPTTLSFGNQAVSTTSGAQTVTLSNTGNVALTINSITLTGTNPGDFAQTNACPASLAAAGSCTISVTFTPTTTGARAASLSISSNDPVNPTLTVALTGTGTAPIAGVAPTSLPFGNQLQNTTSGVQTVTLSNTGNGALTINSITLTGTNPGDFAQTNACGGSVAAAGSCTISVTFHPTASGARAATLSISNNDPAHATLTVTLTGTGTAPIAGVAPTSLAFGNQQLNTTSGAQTVTLSNTGTASLTINSITLTGTNPGDFARTTTCGASVATGGNCTISVTFTPTAGGARAASLSISSSDPLNPTLTVALTGTGLAPNAGVSPATLSFANQLVNTTSGAQTVTLSNTGTGALTINNIGLTGANTGDYAQTNGCGGSVGAGGNCTISVTFHPTASGSRSASLSISSNDPVNPALAVTLTGTGVAPIAGVAPTSLTFVDQLINTTSGTQTVTLSNTGTASLTVNSITLTGTNPGDFARTTTCGASVGIGGNCTISVTFTPTVAAARTASLSISSSDPVHPTLTVTLSGTGISVIAGVTPTSLAFGNQTVNVPSGAQTVTLSNTGTGTLTINSITLTGTNTGDFAQSNACGPTLAGGGSCTISVTFTPTAPFARSASLTITSNDGAHSPLNVSLSGTGLGPIAGVAPTSLAFGNQQVNTTSGAQTVTLSNTGNASVTINSIGLTGANVGDFAQTSACVGSLAAGGNCTISVTFHPTASGSRSASLRISSSDSAHPTLTVTLSGTGVAPIAGVAPTSLAFGNQTVNVTSGAQTVTLSNTGNASLTINSIGLTGGNAGDFTQTNACPASLAAGGGNCAISVTFSPTAMGGRATSLSISTNDPVNPTLTVSLGGTGTQIIAGVAPTSLAFGNQPVNVTSAARTVTLSNTGNATLTINNIGLTGANASDFAQTDACGGSVAGGGSCTISVTFRPTTTGARAASLSISSNDPLNPTLTVSLSGSGSTISLTPSSLSFANQTVNTTSAAQIATLTNGGTLPLVISSIGLSGTNAPDFSRTYTCPIGGTGLAVGASCTISVKFKPTATGPRSANLVVNDNRAGSPRTAALSGTGQ